MKYLALGAHLRHEDVAGVEGVSSFETGLIIISTIAFDERIDVASRELIGRAASVRQALIAREVFIAIRYGWSFSDAHELAVKSEPFLAAWKEKLESCRGLVEVCLKVVTGAPAQRLDRHDFSTGREYIEALSRSRNPAALNEDFRIAAESLFSADAGKQRWNQRNDGASELVALVPRSALAAIGEGGEELRQRFASIPFMISGPWPLEVFADEPG